ncbi:MAG: hypothetical protein J6Y01_09100 [Spirochaetales bacterium]|nr:hypothetical protein [Spirochaetales bacterium]
MIKLKKDFHPESLSTKLAKAEINPDTSFLSDNEQMILSKLIEVSKIINEIFCLQKYADNEQLAEEIRAMNNPALTTFYEVMQGPFDEFDDGKSYIEGIDDKSDKVTFYPEDLTSIEWEDKLQNLEQSGDEQTESEFLSPYTVIQRSGAELIAVPYSEVYKDRMQRASDILYEIVGICDNLTEKEYYRALSNAFLTNDWTDSDIRWLQVEKNNIETVMGPQEIYEDKFMGLKASFTSFVCVRNQTEFKKLAIILRLLDRLQSNLPMLDVYKKQKPSMTSQITVVNLVYNAGDARGCVQTAAFNLPNSHKIKSEFGSKKVLLYNVMEEKFNQIMKPISEIVLSEDDYEKLSYAAYFNFILMHEIGHELGVSFVKDSSGDNIEVSQRLKDLYSIIEEAKADVMGMFHLTYLIKSCFVNDCTYIEACISYLVSLFRTIRFGTENAHCVSNIIQFNYLIQDGAIIPLQRDDDGRMSYTIDFHQFDKSIEHLLTIILTLQSSGDYQKTKDFIKEYSVMDADLKSTLKLLQNVPIDILPNFR